MCPQTKTAIIESSSGATVLPKGCSFLVNGFWHITQTVFNPSSDTPSTTEELLLILSGCQKAFSLNSLKSSFGKQREQTQYKSYVLSRKIELTKLVNEDQTTNSAKRSITVTSHLLLCSS